MRKGKDSYQREKEWQSMKSILLVFSDGKERRYKDIKKATKLNDPTLSKFLNRFKELKLVKERWDMSEYPHAHYYKPEPELTFFSKGEARTEKLSAQIEPALSKGKDPLIILEWIHILSFRNMVEILRRYKKNKNAESQLNFVMGVLVWEPFRVLTWKVLESSKKIIDEIDIDELEKRQNLRWKEVLEKMTSSLGE